MGLNKPFCTIEILVLVELLLMKTVKDPLGTRIILQIKWTQ